MAIIPQYVASSPGVRSCAPDGREREDTVGAHPLLGGNLGWPEGWALEGIGEPGGPSGFLQELSTSPTHMLARSSHGEL